jgi:hypothetical protein
LPGFGLEGSSVIQQLLARRQCLEAFLPKVTTSLADLAFLKPHHRAFREMLT